MMTRMAIDASCLISFIVLVEVIDNKNPFICVENKMKGKYFSLMSVSDKYLSQLKD